MSEKEELYDIAFPKRRRPLTKKNFLNALSKMYGKPIEIKDLNKTDKEVLNQLIENEHAYKESQKELTKKMISSAYRATRKRSIKEQSFNMKKKSRKMAPYEYSEKARPISNPKPSSKPKRKTLKSRNRSRSRSPLSDLSDYFTKLTI